MSFSWSTENIERLKTLYAEGFSASQIAKELSATSRSAVIGKCHRLGLTGKIYDRGNRAKLPKEPKLAKTRENAKPKNFEIWQPSQIKVPPVEAPPPVRSSDLIGPGIAFAHRRMGYECAWIMNTLDECCGRATAGGTQWCASHLRSVWQKGDRHGH